MKKKDQEILFVEERRIHVLEIVDRRNKVTVAELCELFGLSGATIRNDLRQLHNSGLLIRTHGGAVRKMKTGFELNAGQRQVQNLAAKKAIAARAVEFIEDGDRIIMDTGTTTLQLARLVGRAQDLTILTNDLEIALCSEKVEGARTILLGGYLRKGFRCTVGASTVAALDKFVADKAFLGLNGLSLQHGATTPNLQQAETKQAMIAAANKTIVLCDHSKFDKVSFARFAAIEQIDTLVTDAIRDDYKRDLQQRGVEVILASAAG